MVNLLIEKDGELLKLPVTKFISDELNTKLSDFAKATEVVEEEPEEEPEEEDTGLTAYTFKNNELYVGFKEFSGLTKQVTVTTFKPNVDVYLDYAVEHSEDYIVRHLLNRLNIERYGTDSDGTKIARLVLKHLTNNHNKIHYKNRNGIYYSGTFKNKFQPTSLVSDFVFEVPRSDLARFGNASGINISNAKRPVMNNIYPQKTICWGRAGKSAVLSNSKTVFEAAERMLNFFLGSSFNNDLSSNISISQPSLLMAVKRNYNEEGVTGLTDSEYESVRQAVVTGLNTLGGTFLIQNMGFLLLMSTLNIDFSDVKYTMGE